MQGALILMVEGPASVQQGDLRVRMIRDSIGVNKLKVQFVFLFHLSSLTSPLPTKAELIK